MRASIKSTRLVTFFLGFLQVMNLGGSIIYLLQKNHLISVARIDLFSGAAICLWLGSYVVFTFSIPQFPRHAMRGFAVCLVTLLAYTEMP
jgi:hypothetical protein